MSNRAQQADDAVTASTRAVALALFEGMEDVAVMDSLLAPHAELWGIGVGVMDRTQFVAMHEPYTSRPEPVARRTVLHGLIVDGERAAIEMEWEISWPDVTYHQFYHHVLTVRDGQIQSMRMYQDPHEWMRAFPDSRL